MKKKTKKNGVQWKGILFTLAIFAIVTVFFRIYLIKSIKNATREKVKLTEQIKTLQSEIDDLIIEKQKLTDYERIEKYAKEKLGLVPNLKVNEKIFIDKRELNYIKGIVDEKYE